MPTPITGIRNARSSVDVSAVSTVDTDEIDFRLSSDQAIEIVALKHLAGQIDAASTTAILFANAQVSLHAEVVGLEDPDLDIDQTVRDSEIIDAEVITHYAGDDSGAAQGGMTVHITKLTTPWQIMPEGLFTVTNLTHRVETDGVMRNINSIYLIKYRYVRLTLQELGVFLSLRR